MKFLVGDSVTVIAGQDKGKTGTIRQILIKKDKVLIDGVNKKTKHVKGREGRPGEKVEFFAPIHISNVAVLDAKTKKPSRIGYKGEGAKKVRVTRASGEAVAAPGKAVATTAPKTETKKKKSAPKTIKA